MTQSRPGGLSRSLGFLAATGLLAIAPAAFAQQPPHILSVAFVSFVPGAPLSDWLTAGIGLLLAAMAIYILRKRTNSSGRLLSGILALVTGATLLSVTGYRMVSEAGAFVTPAINLTVSPGTIDVAPFFPSAVLGVLVTNTTSQLVRITAITLDPGLYTISPTTTCAVGLTLVPNGTCMIELLGAS
jgi:hypothetical protein